MALAIAYLDDNATADAGVTETTASVSPAAGSAVLTAVAARSEALGSLADPGDALIVSGNGLAWDDAGDSIGEAETTQVLYDINGNAMRAGLFVGTGTPSPGVQTLGTVDGDHSMGRWIWFSTQIQGLGQIVQAKIATGQSTTAGVTLAAFADPANWTLLFVVTDINTSTFQRKNADWTRLGPHGDTDALSRFAAYLDEADTSPSATLGTSREWVAIALELAPAGGGAGFPGALLRRRSMPRALLGM